MTELVEAAGGLVVREGDSGVEVVVVHRPRYDDWSFPKGKLDPGETWEAAALREVEEETGLRARLVRELPSARYEDHKGRSKLVRYWLMELEGGGVGEIEGAGAGAGLGEAGGPFTPNEEVDELRWLSPAEAAALLTYSRDRELLAAL